MKKRCAKKGWIRIKNDCRGLYIRSDNLGPGAMRKGRRVHFVAGVPMKKIYDASKNKKLYPIYMDEYVCLTELAIHLYNIKEHTQFSQVKLLKIVTEQGGYWVNHITFEALSPLGDATVFKTTITEIFRQYRKIEIKPVKLKCSQSHDNGEKSKQDPPLDIAQQPVIKTFPAKALVDLAPFLSQYALIMYNIDEVKIKREAVHDISSLKVVKAIKLDSEEGTLYHVTFTASLRDESKNIETFETQICVPTLFPNMTMEVREIKMIKHD
ncbi:hypothetical protein DCAR_0104920 [Daucus carota subsp. sativus]|uniref:Uncharacterized protein n=1 Tax=Daucus carota subsp. sativus TaxID=79200 RepID=A0AAF0WCG2_DAUCS|nr:PREDICTED: uncharacterized protein LOC108217823 [Daucus carota subsp. sativus]XP_017246378.1 PREDICTED: uncharacterized protein LOC108217823 [Daucus carota subsp. sativus]XP_017246450.1 PREDICTED: uncharacterized protein LOC108217823 [Daucus carota subsp. sativus]WOG85728.1 hypothetical protein DCAR_0104920 [Daucus carota subsp. sativus]